LIHVYKEEENEEEEEKEVDRRFIT